jgi:hypothetical protein
MSKLQAGTKCLGKRHSKEPSPRVRCDSQVHAPIRAHFDRKIPLGLAVPDHTVPYGTDLSRDAFPGTSCLATIGVVATGRACRHFATASGQKAFLKAVLEAVLSKLAASPKYLQSSWVKMLRWQNSITRTTTRTITIEDSPHALQQHFELSHRSLERKSFLGDSTRLDPKNSTP